MFDKVFDYQTFNLCIIIKIIKYALRKFVNEKKPILKVIISCKNSKIHI